MGIFDSIGNVVSNLVTNTSNQLLNNKTNKFNSEQAELNRQFQAQQALIAREWQEEQYNKYSSPKALVSQYDEAGLNPALMYGQNLQSSTGSSPSPSGSAATGTAIPNQAPHFMNVVEDILALKKLDAEIENIEADSNAKNSAAFASEREGLYKNSLVSLNSQTIKESKAKIQKIIQETHSEKLKQSLLTLQPLLTREEIKLKRGQQLNLSYDTFKKQFEYQYKEKFGFYPESSAVKTAFGILGEAVRNIELGLTWIGSKLGF